jgi:hypothetical protein
VLKTAGSQSITVTDTVTGSIKGSFAVNVSPAAAASLKVTGYPSATTAGTSNSFTVTALDGYGNVATGYRGTVHFTSSDAKARLPTDYTFAAADKGAHTFAATLHTVGTQWLKAIDTANSVLVVIVSGIQVNA